ncbi:hypothetical protein ACFLZ7_00740 [Nanoarchaeota archaeon]
MTSNLFMDYLPVLHPGNTNALELVRNSVDVTYSVGAERILEDNTLKKEIYFANIVNNNVYQNSEKAWICDEKRLGQDKTLKGLAKLILDHADQKTFEIVRRHYVQKDKRMSTDAIFHIHSYKWGLPEFRIHSARDLSTKEVRELVNNIYSSIRKRMKKDKDYGKR